MKEYKLLTPGPLTTSTAVKREMLIDRCTWDEEYKSITQGIRANLLKLAGVQDPEYTVVLLQGSGSFGVEATLNSCINKAEKCLFITNGTYGERMVKMAEKIGISHEVYNLPFDTIPKIEHVERLLKEDKAITHVAMVHCETTTGLLNPIEAITVLCKKNGKKIIIDAMSSFGGVSIDLQSLNIDFLISSSNKCIQGVPGFSFVIANTQELILCKNKATSLVLDIVDQWEVMKSDGKWRYTSPTHVVAAFSKAIDELIVEGGILAREKRYVENNRLLIEGMRSLGFKSYVKTELQSPIITTFIYPTPSFDFNAFYYFVKERGYILYPGKLTTEDTFRIGNIGEIYPDDINKLLAIIQSYKEGNNV